MSELKTMDYLEVYNLSNDELLSYPRNELIEAIIQFSSEVCELRNVKCLLTPKLYKFAKMKSLVKHLNLPIDYLYKYGK